MAFLFREYRVIGIFAVVVTLLLGVGIGWGMALAYISGAVCFLAAGFVGMQIARAPMYAPLRQRPRGSARLWTWPFPEARSWECPW